jgi:DNA-binding NarL/FixJ family response regulator
LSADIRVAIVEDNPEYRSGLEQLLQHSPGFQLAGSYRTGEAVIQAASTEGPAPDLVIVDLGLPEMNGAETLKVLKKLWPGTRAIVFTVFEDPAKILDAIAAGADGYALKSISAPQVLHQLRTVHEGGALLTGVVARTVLESLRRQTTTESRVDLALTDRELDVLRGLARGMTYKQIAETVGIGLDTVRTHLRSVYHKLQVHNAAGAVARALRDRIV